MSMTEEEAKTKWCPYSRVVGDVSYTPKHQYYNRIDPALPLNQESTCLGSRCMAWRTVSVNELSEAVFSGTREGKSGTGFCGLAGAPQ